MPSGKNHDFTVEDKAAFGQIRECGDEFRKFADLIDLAWIDVYGHVSDTVIERLHQKSEMLGRGTVVVHEFYAGFAR